MQPSLHAQRRWQEYFAAHDLAVQYQLAKPAGKSTKRQISRQCRLRYRPRFEDRGVYYLRSPADAIFVVAPGEFIVDVFPLGNKAVVRA